MGRYNPKEVELIISIKNELLHTNHFRIICRVLYTASPRHSIAAFHEALLHTGTGFYGLLPIPAGPARPQVNEPVNQANHDSPTNDIADGYRQ
jgi:hypothetical protein